MLTLVAQDGLVLQYAAFPLYKDKDVVLAAVAQNGLALKFAAAALKQDKDVVLAAVAQYGRALAERRRDVNFHAAAVEKVRVLGFRAPKNDKAVVIAAVAQLDAEAAQKLHAQFWLFPGRALFRLAFSR